MKREYLNAFGEKCGRFSIGQNLIDIPFNKEDEKRSIRLQSTGFLMFILFAMWHNINNNSYEKFLYTLVVLGHVVFKKIIKLLMSVGMIYEKRKMEYDYIVIDGCEHKDLVKTTFIRYFLFIPFEHSVFTYPSLKEWIMKYKN